jgi:Flp pilus assembly protein CpaB
MREGTRSAPEAPAPANGRRGVVPPPAQVLGTRYRQRSWVLAGVVFVLVAAVAVALVVSRSGGKVSAIVMAKPVPAGHVITRGDLTTAQLATDSIPSFAGKHMNEVVGKTAKVGLVKGELLNKDMLGDAAVVSPDAAQVGVIVKPGQLPAGGLSPGDMVMVVVLPATTPGTSNAAGSPTVLASAAPVIGSATLDSGAGSVVTVQVPRSQAAQLAAASSAGQVALVKVTQQ